MSITGTEPRDLSRAITKATKNGNTAAVKEMLEQDPLLINARDKDDSTPLHYAAWKGHVEIARTLLRLGADVNAQNRNTHWGNTPLHAAAHANNRAIAEILISHGAEVNARDLNGNTPLAHTRLHNGVSVARLLVEHGGIDPNHPIMEDDAVDAPSPERLAEEE